MRILSLDPSSSAIGWAMMSGPPDRLLAFHLIRSGSSNSVTRIDRMTRDLLAVANEHTPDVVVMEWATGKVHRRVRAQSAGAGLATLGQAQGSYRAALMADGFDVRTVTDGEWTCGVSKDARADRVAFEWADYRAWRPKDHGLDVADAIGLGAFWLRRELHRSLMNPKRA
jgi:Holliday junction resolvasome RuvABC endonuclease subunit